MRRLILTATLVLLLGAGVARAQDPPPPPPPPPPPHKPMPPLDGPDGHKELRKRIQAMRLARLTQELDLDETATAKLFPLLNRHDEKVSALMEDRAKTIHELDAALRDGKTDALSALLDKLAEDEKGVHESDEATHKKVREILTPAQAAKFVLFHEKFQDEVRAFLDDARRDDPRRDDMKREMKMHGPGAGMPGLEHEKAMLEKTGMLIQNGQLDDAIGLATKVIAMDPKCAGAYVMRAHAHAQKAELDGAIADLEQAMELDPDAAEPHAVRAHVRIAKHDLEAARADADWIIERHPGKAEGWALRGLAETEQKKYAEAAKDLTRAIELAPGEAPFYRFRGDARSHTDPKGAVGDYEKFLELAPKSPETGYVKKKLAELQPR